MPVLIIHDLPDADLEALRTIAADRRISVEALALHTLCTLAATARRGGIDFDRLHRDRAALGIGDDGPPWTQALDDPALSRHVLNLPDPLG